MKSSSYMAFWSTDPIYDPPFASEPTTLQTFMEYLAKKGKVKVAIECHAVTRSDKDGYDVSNSERVGFRMKDGVCI